MRHRPCSLTWALAAVGAVLQAGSAANLRQNEPASPGDAAKAFAKKASSRLHLLGAAASQVLATPGVEQELGFSKTLHKVQSQLQESAAIMEKWGNDYAHKADAGEMAATLASKGAAYEVHSLKKQLMTAVEADQEDRLEQPKRLAELTKKVAILRAQVEKLKREEAHKKKQQAATALISNVWPRPPLNATKAEVGFFMHNRKSRVNARDQDEEDQEHLMKLENRLGSLETQLQEAQDAVAKAHDDSEEAHREAIAS